MNIVVSRDANRIESDQRPIRYEITPSVKAIVELVGGYVSHRAGRVIATTTSPVTRAFLPEETM